MKTGIYISVAEKGVISVYDKDKLLGALESTTASFDILSKLISLIEEKDKQIKELQKWQDIQTRTIQDRDKRIEELEKEVDELKKIIEKHRIRDLQNADINNRLRAILDVY